MTSGNAKTLPLNDMHTAAGARFGSFAGWHMPLTYPLGVLKEHLWTRQDAGLFDISHMRLFAVEGPQAATLLSRACPLDAAALPLGQGKLSFFLDEQAGILDDLIVTRTGAERFVVVANAGNAESDEKHLRVLAAGHDCKVEVLPFAFLALQGPKAEDVLRRAGFGPLPERFMTGLELEGGGFVSRSGYTGEDGFEIGLPAEQARALAEKLLADERVRWIGLAARDSLRLEAGLCLHGQDISPETDPVAAGLLWAIPKPLREKGGFLGAEALAALGSPKRRRCGLRPEGRLPVRAGAPLFDETGRPVGTVTSGSFGPSVDHPVAMGLLDSELVLPGQPLHTEVRGTKIPVTVHALPFTPHRFRKG
ncbi:MAG: glycine cleavage system aminomethyltransferase GcvT [Methylobacterium mesophilicum]|nr:glycine cleavage system aminomethyltransferase GcvT [Methylobacterium mesophilicum]